MIQSLSIKNFRGFESLEVSGLQRVNIITGANGAGKTSFLEALFMCSGSGALALNFKLRAFRQLGNKIDVPADQSNYEAIWEDMFYRMDSNRTIDISGTGDSEDSRSVRIYNEHRSIQVLPFGDKSVSTSSPQIVSQWRRNADAPLDVRPSITAQGITFDAKQSQFDHFPILMFGPHIGDSAEENAKRFSLLSRSGKADIVTKALCDEFDFIESLSLEYSAGGPAVYAKLRDHQAKLPLGIVSDGVHKMFSLLLGIALSEDGMVLIDQIEDGFYYKKFESMWRLIYKFAKESNCQLFITSHSSECLKALLPVIKGNEGDFAMLHADQIRGLILFHTVEGKYFEAALENGFEIR